MPFPVKGCRFTVLVPYLDADGDPLDPTTPDTEKSIDGAAFADCTEEVTTITGTNGTGYITLTGDEMNGSAIALAFKVASGPKATLMTLYPRVLPILFSGTATAGAAGTITLSATAPPLVDKQIIGCIIRTTGGTGGAGGSGSLGNQARVITDYVASTRVATVSPDWETNPSSDTTYEVLLTEMSLIRWADVKLWKNVVPNDLVSARVDASVGAIANDAITAAAIATDAIGSAELAATAANKIRDTIINDATAFPGADVAAIKAKTDNLPSDPADESLVIAATDAIVTLLGSPAGASVSADIAVISGYLADIGIKKNTAFTGFPFLMIDSSDHVSAKTGLTITATRSIDGAAFAACANSAVEDENGWYHIDLDDTDLNGDVVILRFTGTGADDRTIPILTQA